MTAATIIFAGGLVLIIVLASTSLVLQRRHLERVKAFAPLRLDDLYVDHPPTSRPDPGIREKRPTRAELADAFRRAILEGANLPQTETEPDVADEIDLARARVELRLAIDRAVTAHKAMSIEAGLDLALSSPEVDDALFFLGQARDDLRRALGQHVE